MIDNRHTHTGKCHCKSVIFMVKLSDELKTARRCTCSMCSKRGAVAVSAELKDIEFVAGEDKLTCYTFGTGVAQHYFCSICGIYTHHQRRSNPTQYGINLSCLEGQTPFLNVVPVLDGKNHPRDQDASDSRSDNYKGLEVGLLKFVGNKDKL